MKSVTMPTGPLYKADVQFDALHHPTVYAARGWQYTPQRRGLPVADETLTRTCNNRAKNERFLVGAKSQAPVVSTFAIRWLLCGVVLGANFLPDSKISIGAHYCESK